MRVLAKDTAGFNLIDAQTGATDAAGTSGTSKFSVTSAGAGTFAAGVTITTGGLGVSAGNTNVQALTATTIVGSNDGDASTSTTGALRTAGGLGVAKAAHIGTGLTVDSGGAGITNEANGVVVNAYSKQATQTAAVMRVLAQDTDGFNLIDAQTGATDAAGTSGTSKFSVTSAGAGTFAAGVTITTGGLGVSAGDTNVQALTATTIVGS